MGLASFICTAPIMAFALVFAVVDLCRLIRGEV